MSCFPTTRWCALLALAAVLTAAPQVAQARTVAVLFRGFLATPPAGMDRLAATLEDTFGGNPAQPFSSQVFDYTGQQQAFDYIDGFSDIDCLILVGHSFGGDSAVDLAEDFLGPAGIEVDLLILFDSVGAGDLAKPQNVAEAFNYYQISTGLIEPQGRALVGDATNAQVEVLYGVTNSDITHTEIDCPLFERSEADYLALFGSQPDLHARVVEHVWVLCTAAVPALGPLGFAVLGSSLLATAYRRTRRDFRPGAPPARPATPWVGASRDPRSL